MKKPFLSRSIFYVSAVLCVVFGAFIVLSVGCGKSGSGGSSRGDTDTSIGVAAAIGALLISEDGAFFIDIPPGALAEDTAISIRKIDPPVGLANAELIGPVYELGPDGLQFQVPVRLGFRVDAVPDANGRVPVPFPFAGANEGPYEYLSNLQLAVLDGVTEVSGDLHHFSVVGLGDEDIATPGAGVAKDSLTFSTPVQVVDAGSLEPFPVGTGCRFGGTPYKADFALFIAGTAIDPPAGGINGSYVADDPREPILPKDLRDFFTQGMSLWDTKLSLCPSLFDPAGDTLAGGPAPIQRSAIDSVVDIKGGWIAVNDWTELEVDRLGVYFGENGLRVTGNYQLSRGYSVIIESELPSANQDAQIGVVTRNGSTVGPGFDPLSPLQGTPGGDQFNRVQSSQIRRRGHRSRPAEQLRRGAHKNDRAVGRFVEHDYASSERVRR